MLLVASLLLSEGNCSSEFNDFAFPSPKVTPESVRGGRSLFSGSIFQQLWSNLPSAKSNLVALVRGSQKKNEAVQNLDKAEVRSESQEKVPNTEEANISENSLSIESLFQDGSISEKENEIEHESDNTISTKEPETKNEKFSDEPVIVVPPSGPSLTPLLTQQKTGLESSLITRVQNIFSKIVKGNPTLSFLSPKASKKTLQEKKTKTAKNEGNAFLNQVWSFFGWSSSSDEKSESSSDDELSFELEEDALQFNEDDPIEEAETREMGDILLQKIHPVLTDMFGTPDISENQLMQIFSDPKSIEDKLLSRTSLSHARELAEAFSLYEGLSLPDFVSNLAQVDSSSLTNYLSSVGSEVKNSLYQLWERDEEPSRISKHSYIGNEEYPVYLDPAQGKAFNFSVAVNKNFSDFGSFFPAINFTSPYLNFSKVSFNIHTSLEAKYQYYDRCMLC